MPIHRVKCPVCGRAHVVTAKKLDRTKRVALKCACGARYEAARSTDAKHPKRVDVKLTREPSS